MKALNSRIFKILVLLGVIKAETFDSFCAAEDLRNSDEIKREMCKRALQSDVCPHACDICAWNTLE
jgi:hypothetical protein